MTFSELVDELHGRPSEELSEIADLARRYATEKRRAEIAANGKEGLAAFHRGELVTYTDIDDLMRSLDEP